MKIPPQFAAAALVLAILGVPLLRRPHAADARIDALDSLGGIPVLANGRPQPLDSLARNTLRALSGRETLRTADGRHLTAAQWLGRVLFHDPAADTDPIFLIRHPEVLELIGQPAATTARLAFAEIQPRLATLESAARPALALERVARSPFQRALTDLHDQITTYQRLRFSIRPLEQTQLAELNATAPTPETRSRLAFIDSVAPFRPIIDTARPSEWQSIASSLLASTPAASPTLGKWIRADFAFAGSDPGAFIAATAELSAPSALPGSIRSRVRAEHVFNLLHPFYTAMLLYLILFLFTCAFWLTKSPWIHRAGSTLLVLIWVLHTVALVVRMAIQGRPPVTNLYSSAIFIGWAAAGLGILIERFGRNGAGQAVAAGLGFPTLLIAHHLAASGDTLEMMRAVLDSNFWLATHVIIITLGYSATFVAGAVGILFLIRRPVAGPGWPAAAKHLSAMLYGIVCFALLFSFTGTILGGIWADQSWGRFWGWDPKENGALLIVIWNAIILHARWAGLARPTALAQMAVFGNVVTAFSWFGVNLLGVGLHSYGFTEGGFFWLATFAASQLLVIALGFLPATIALHRPRVGAATHA